MDDELMLRVLIDDQYREASLQIPAYLPRSALMAEPVSRLLAEHQVELTDAVKTALASLAASPPPADEAATLVIARASEPVPGQDGSVTWLSDEDTDQPPRQADDRIDYYNVNRFTVVRPRQVLGQVTAPTPGIDGRDVRGQRIAAKPGNPAPFHHDETITCDSHGKIIALRQGVLVREGDSACVSPVLEVAENVDFSTGNIIFDGDVSIRNDVRDCFRVRATGTVQVRGVIEEAIIEADGDLLALGGIAGGDKAHVRIAGNMSARYLGNLRGEIRGDLTFEREAINCNLIVGGGVRSQYGSLIGGRLRVAGAVEVATVGSDGGVVTVLSLGDAVELRLLAQRFLDIRDRLETRQGMLTEQMQLLDRGARRLRGAAAQRLADLAAELHRVGTQLVRTDEGIRRVTARIARQCVTDLRVTRTLHHGVEIELGTRRFRIVDAMRGPLRVTIEKQMPVLCAGSGRSWPLADIAKPMLLVA